MKLDGMDAASRVTSAPVSRTQDTTQGNVSAAGGATKKAADYVERAVSAANAKRVLAKQPGDAQSYDKQHSASQDEKTTEEMTRDALEKANRALTGSNRKFEISVHEKTKDIMVRVVDTDTNEVIREIPPRKIIDLVASLCEIAGILYDEKR